MKFSDLKIGTRLALSFGLVLVLMLSISALSLRNLRAIGELADEMVNTTLVRVNAVSVIDATARATARSNLEMVIDTRTGAIDRLTQDIRKNGKTIDDAFAELEKLAVTDVDRSALKALSEARDLYTKSYEAAGEEVRSSQSEEALQRLLVETMPLLDALQAHITKLSDRQKASAKLAAEHSAEVIRTSMFLLVALSVAALVLGFALGWLIKRSITRPISYAVKIAGTVADGDLTQSIETNAKDETGELLGALQSMNDRLRGIVAEVRTSVESVSSAASQIATGNQDLSDRTEQAAANLQQTAASMEELTATVNQSADTARQANQLAGTAVQAAARGGDVVQQVVARMQEITASSNKINDIIGVIDGIAFQTNILALNAAVEAARAGEQGRGFAVVAGEVRGLARRSASAAKEIKQLITASAETVGAGSKQVAEAGQSMEEIISSVRHVTNLIGEILASSNEQRDDISQVNQAVANLDRMTRGLLVFSAISDGTKS